jgi:alpha-tubulin suppressor-like RCC1 family protein
MKRLLLHAALALLTPAACDNPGGSDRRTPERVDVLSGDLQNGTAGTELATPLVVRVLDARGQPVRDHPVTFVVTGGGGSVAAGTVRTDAQGEARERWTLGTVAGDTQRVEARAADASAGRAPAFAAFRAVGQAGAPARVVLSSDTLRFHALSQTEPLAVSVFDTHGNAVPGQTVTVVSENAGVAELDTGLVARAVRNGTTRLIATLQGSTAADTAIVVVRQVAVWVKVSPGPDSLPELGITRKLQPEAVDARGYAVTDARFQYAASGPSIHVDPNGVVTAVSAGTDSVRVSADSAWAWARIHVGDYLITEWSTVSAGPEHACALRRRDGLAFCWGLNGDGQVGNGSTGGPEVCRDGVPCHALATRVAGGRRFFVISVGNGTTCATGESTTYCWGRGDHGQLGNGGTSNSPAPVAVSGAPAYGTIAVGGNHACQVADGGVVWCWGLGTSGQLGNGAASSSSVPVRVSSDVRFFSVTAGDAHTCGIAMTNSTVYCWGANESGQLGDGSTTQRNVPTPVANGTGFRHISAEMSTTCGLKRTSFNVVLSHFLPPHTVYCWGSNRFGALGGGSEAAFSSTPMAATGGERFRESMVSSGGIRGCAIDNSQLVAYCWGALAFSSSGSVTASSSSPVAVPGAVRMYSIETSTTYACGWIDRLMCWGRNAWGTLGNGTSTDSDTPVYVRTRGP